MEAYRRAARASLRPRRNGWRRRRHGTRMGGPGEWEHRGPATLAVTPLPVPSLLFPLPLPFPNWNIRPISS